MHPILHIEKYFCIKVYFNYFSLYFCLHRANQYMINYQRLLEEIYQDIKSYAGKGEPATYIPELAKVNPDQFGMCIHTLKGKKYTFGQADVPFSIQSISKVFSLAMCLSFNGEELWARVGLEPSGARFNSVIQLELEKGIPRNPFINAGALVMADMLISSLEQPEAQFLDFIRALCNDGSVSYNRTVAVSERQVGYLNVAIANLLKYYGNIQNDIERVLQFYFTQCSIEMNCHSLATAFLAFANHNQPFNFGNVQLTSSQVKRINALMQTCGFYNEAGHYSYLVGLPGKSGVGGGIAAIYPLRYAVSVWSPRLNENGNSVMGIKALELLTTKTHESIF